jgi:hypothetical protein
MSKKNQYKVTTRLVHGPEHSAKWDFTHHVTPPLSSSTTYRLDSAKRGARGFQEFGQLVTDTGEAPVYIYDRLDEPTRSILEGELAEVEGGEACVTFASGMAAISGALGSVLVAGDEVIAHPVLYGCTHSLFENWYPRPGSVRAPRRPERRWPPCAAAVNDATRALYFESPVNPSLELIDIGALRVLADEVNCSPAAGAQAPDLHRQHLRHALRPAAPGPGRRCGAAFADQEPGRLRHGARRRRHLSQVDARETPALPQGLRRHPGLQVGLGDPRLRPADPRAAPQAPAVHGQEGRDLAREARGRGARRLSGPRRASRSARWPRSSCATSTATSRRAT